MKGLLFSCIVSALVLCACGGDPVQVAGTGSTTGVSPDIGGGSTTGGTGGGATTGGIIDVGESDIGEPDTKDIEAGGFGAPCDDNADCDSEFCIESFDGFVCTETCLDDCPSGFACKSVINTLPDLVFVCVPDVNSLCKPCVNDKQCNGGTCTTINDDEEQTYCVSDCDTDDDCPGGFHCGVFGEPTGADFKGCRPDSNTCSCTAANVDDVSSCIRANEVGTCPGFRVCNGAEGWGPCSGATPVHELCDGADNDCDGLIDEDVGDGDICTQTNVLGTCEGLRTCLGKNGLVCSAAVPGAEFCDYKDNDCDGETDEDFKVGDIYDHPQHCGVCGVDCEASIGNAKGACDAVQFNPPQCVVDFCQEGYYQVNDFLCSPVPGKLCDVCETDEHCVVAGSKCVTLTDGQFCSVPCAENDACPLGYACQELDEAKVCTPESGSCSCDGTNLQLQKACDVQWQNAGQPIVTCSGVQQCTAGGWTECLLPEDVCDGVDNDCDGTVDGPWLNEQGKYYTDQHCGLCNNNCSAQPNPQATGACSTDAAIPTCAMQCLEGWFDVNVNPADGCECEWASVDDHPDAADHNCDGVDGQIDNAIFVSKSGHDDNPGTIDLPALTVQAGANKAAAFGKRDVYVATGVYSENVTLVAGVAIYGGYSGDFFDRDVTLYETAILGQPPKAGKQAAVAGQNLDGPLEDGATKLDGFSIFGFSNKQVSGSSYAVWLVDCGSQVTLSNNVLYAGDGGNGLPGEQGISGQPGAGGVTGAQAFDIGAPFCSAAKDNNPGGSGGQRICGAGAVSGGNGGTAICPDYDSDSGPPSCPAQPFLQPATLAELGKTGQGSLPGAGGIAGNDAYIDKKFGPYNSYNCIDTPIDNCSSCLLPPSTNKEGTPGQPGAEGTHGPIGQGCVAVAGNVVNNLWQPGPGTEGPEGQAGSGGGGGGAAGGVETANCSDHYAQFTDVGASGGGGGSGGCGGTGGNGGTGGGGSFGIFLSWSAPPTTMPTIANNAIERGNGGTGGNGGPGGTGGAGGAAGNGGQSGQSSDATFCTAGGGEGGAGGHGGHGAGGGGGCGGVSFGIFISGANGQPAWKVTNAFSAKGNTGTGGVGGASLGSNGTGGLPGAGGDTNY
ncbi:MAG: hypothetical protein ACI9WU_000740 [Myxococcota bacterium]|jgi:hypothetical protein